MSTPTALCVFCQHRVRVSLKNKLYGHRYDGGRSCPGSYTVPDAETVRMPAPKQVEEPVGIPRWLHVVAISVAFAIVAAGSFLLGEVLL